MSPGSPWSRRVAAACLALLFSLLPALVAGWSLDAPAAPGEPERLVRAYARVAGESTEGSVLATRFHLLTVNDTAVTGSHEALVLARRAQLLGLFALGGLAFVAVAMVRGRLVAAGTCLLLACSGPVREGFVLRPETAQATFLGFATLLLVLLQRFESRRELLRACAAGIAAGTTFALALVALPTAQPLLVPGLCLAGVTGIVSLRFLVVARRHPLLLPLRAFPRRVLPWLLASLGTLIIAVGLSDPNLGEMTASRQIRPHWGVGWPQIPLWGVTIVGLIVVAYRVGLRLGRRGWLPDEGVLLFGAVGALVVHLLQQQRDTLPLAVAAAWLAAEGITWLLRQGGVRWRARTVP